MRELTPSESPSLCRLFKSPVLNELSPQARTSPDNSLFQQRCVRVQMFQPEGLAWNILIERPVTDVVLTEILIGSLT